MKNKEVEISQVYWDDRNSNKSRPYVVTVGVPNSKRKASEPRLHSILFVRSPTHDGAELIRAFLLQQRRSQRSVRNFIRTVNAIMQGTYQISRNESSRRYEATLKSEAAEASAA